MEQFPFSSVTLYGSETPDSWKFIQATSELAHQISRTALKAAWRIDDRLRTTEQPGSQYPHQNIALEIYSPAELEALPEFWATDVPDKVFPSRPIYTITSTLALDMAYPNENVLLWAPIDHQPSEVQTHRGLGLSIFSGFMRGLGFSLGRKDECLWLGSQVDGEQFIIEDTIARNGPAIDDAIVSTFFDVPGIETFLHTNATDLHLHPMLRHITQAVLKPDAPEGQGPEIERYIDTLLETMYRTMGTREGWYSSLEGLLKHKQTSRLPNGFNADQFEHYLATTAKQGEPVPRASRAMVLEVDPERLFSLVPVYIFPISTRPPEAIIPAPCLPTTAVTAVYVEDDGFRNDIPGQFQPILKPLRTLAVDAWLPDSNGKHLTPQQTASLEADPATPLCIGRYANDPKWAQHIAAGDMAPWWTGIGKDARKPAGTTEHVLRQVVQAHVKESHVLRSQHMAEDARERLRRELVEAIMKEVTLPSVRSVRMLEGANTDRYYNEPPYTLQGVQKAAIG
jgi:hypothetical protein